MALLYRPCANQRHPETLARRRLKVILGLDVLGVRAKWQMGLCNINKKAGIDCAGFRLCETLELIALNQC